MIVLVFGRVFYPNILKKGCIKEFIDVHLMIDPVDELAQSFIEAGADLISFHPEASKHIHRSIHAIKDKGCKAGLVYNPATPLHTLESVLEDLDLVLIMSVNPGFGGQSFIHGSIEKIAQVRKMIDALGKDIRLEVDGGINKDTIALASEAGADTFVAGSAIFNTENTLKMVLILFLWLKLLIRI